MVAPRIVRVVAAPCASEEKSSFLIVASKDFRYIFDDIDSTFVQNCATVLSRFWQRRALREALNAKDAFLRGITHQLRTPIHGILGSVELLTEELKARNVMPSTASTSPGSSPSMEQSDPHLYIRTIRTSARELISTVNSLIKLNQWAGIAQAERKTSFHTLEHVETALFKEISPILPIEIRDRPSIILHHKSPSTCDSLNIDLSLFVDCVQPLVINAIQSAPGGVVAVTLCINDNLRTFNVDVEDSGSGIDSKDHERIFVAHEKLDEHTIGAGLGLTLSCKSAALMNGKASLVRSEPGVGSLFQVVFRDPNCSSSPSARPLLMERLKSLPKTFHRCQWTSRTSLLGRHFNNYLKNRGYIESATAEGSLILIDFTPDLSQVYTSIGRIPAGQVGICLVPECVYSPVDFMDKKILRQNNVVFVQGPFLHRTLEEALVRADSILEEQATPASAATVSAGAKNHDVADEISGATYPNEQARKLQQREPALKSPMAQVELEQSLKMLRIATGPLLPPLRPSPRSSKPMALLVDDNRINLRLLEMYCHRRNLPYRTAKDGEEAVRFFTDHRIPITDPLLRQPLVTQPFDLILMDLQMPKCDGIEATRQIRLLEREHQWEKSVIFIVTGQDSPADRLDAADAGADEYLVKPIGPNEMDRWIKQEFPNADL